MTPERRFRLGVLAAALLGLALRLSGIDWDGGTHLHPDERFLTMVATSIRFPPAGSFFDTAASPANPHNAGHSFFVYGTLPVFAFRAAGLAFGRATYDGIVPVQRLLSCAADFFTTFLVALLAFRLAPRARAPGAALLAAALWALAPYPIQQARFGTVDAIGTCLALAAVVLACGGGRAPRLSSALLAGAALGAAAASKPNLVVFAVPVTLLLAFPPALEKATPFRTLARLLPAAGGASFLVFRVANPYAFQGPGFLGLAPNPKWFASFAELAGMLRGESWFPPGVQWVDRVPVLDFLSSLLCWSTGPALGLLLFLAALGILSRAFLRHDPDAVRLLPVLLPPLVLLLWQATRFTASVRHAHPYLPLLVATAAASLGLLAPRRGRWIAGAVTVLTAGAGLAFVSIALSPHTRVEASAALARAYPAGARVTFEYWDDPLPVPGAGIDLSLFAGEPLPVFDHPDSPAKARALAASLDRADVVVLSSRRGLGTIARLPDTFPVTSEYYRLLWSGALGFEPFVRVSRPPRLGPLVFDDRLAEEALSVYDHPQVVLFRKGPRWDRSLAEALLVRASEATRDADPAPPWGARARGVPPDVTPQERAREHPASWAPPLPPRRGAWGNALPALLWLGAAELLGVLGLLALGPIAASRAAPAAWLARPLGFALAGLGWSLLGHLLPFFQLLALPLGAAGVVAVLGTRRGRASLSATGGAPRAVFLALFALFLAIRAFNPEVYWGEKPMDGALLAAAMRAPQLPLPEPWFAGASLDYYGHGFLPVALLARTAGASPGVAFNLACATLPALFGSALVGAGSLLAGSSGGGAFALVFVLLSGTLAPFLNRAWLANPFGFDGFWAASRVVPGGINEFPLFTALFADLHAHFLSWAPFGALLLLALLRSIDRPEAGSLSDRRGAVLLGLLGAAVHLTNPWETPLAALLVAFALPARPSDPAASRAAVLEPFLFAAPAALLAALPTLLSTRSAEVFFGRAEGEAVPALALVELFGLPLLVVAAAWVARGRGGSRGERLALGLALLGLAVLVFASTFVVADRMNTLFKFGLQARVLLGLAAGALLPALLAERRARGTAFATFAAVLLALLAVTALAGAAHVVAVLRTQRVPGPRPALDGFAWVPVYDPAGAVRMETWNARGGIEPILDPPGTPYGEFLQTTMRTGRPTLVGWPWHLVQRRRSAIEILRREADAARILEKRGDRIEEALLREYGISPDAVVRDGGR